MTKFDIPEENIPKLNGIIDRINKRAKKLGFPEIKITIGEGVSRKMHVMDEFNDMREVLTVVHPVMVEGEKPVLSGWSFMGKLEHLKGTEDTIVMGDVPQQYQSCPPKCDHCETNRNRTETFILQNIENDEFKQIGRSCLKDFFNGDDPMMHASFLQSLDDLKEQFSDLENLGYGQKSSYIEVFDVLKISNAFVRTYGYMSSAAAETHNDVSTGVHVRNVFFGGKEAPCPKVTKQDEEKAKDIIEWLESDACQAKKSTSSYMHNLCTVTTAGAVHRKHIALFASATVAYDRAIAEKINELDARVSDYVGAPAEKIGPIEITISAKILIPGTMYGDKMLHLMKDTAGNKISWFCTGNSIGTVGDVVHINGTVKDQTIYRGDKQTILQRVTTTEDKLFEAIEQRKPASFIAKMLIGEINLDHKSFYPDMTPLMIACKNGDAETAELLLKKNASPDISEKNGYTAINFAASLGHIQCIDKLMEWGANVTIEDKYGLSIAQLLEDAQLKLSTQMDTLKSKSLVNEPEWARQAEDIYLSSNPHYPISSLGKKKDFEALLLGAKAAAEAAEERFFAPTTPVVIYEKNGIPFIASGHLQIAVAHSEKKNSVETIVCLEGIPSSVKEIMKIDELKNGEKDSKLTKQNRMRM
jgi:hypothetical protein